MKSTLDTTRTNAVVSRLQHSITEALNMILRGEITAGRLMIRDYINATGSMNDIAAKLKRQKTAIVRMLGPKGNPMLESFIPVVQACAEREHIELSVCEECCSA